ncbi:helix-turn-helix domain-containing protein [Enterococcus sp. DIV0756]|uniref:PucR family transcriptional regulator n=1 Tax=Enterococcus sp. DIV0756 TaxID=2774636 RepID=UPI003F688E00
MPFICHQVGAKDRNAVPPKELHIHRNSLLYRIGRIEELFHVSLKDSNTFRSLMIAFYMMELAEQMYHESST